MHYLTDLKAYKVWYRQVLQSKDRRPWTTGDDIREMIFTRDAKGPAWDSVTSSFDRGDMLRLASWIDKARRNMPEDD